MISDMTPEAARMIFAHVVTQRLAGGKRYRGDDIGISNIIDAIIVIAHEGNKADADLKAQITLLNRQISAAKAREAKRTLGASSVSGQLANQQYLAGEEDA